MSYSSSPYHYGHHHHTEDVRDYRGRYPDHARHHHSIDEPYRVQHSDTDAISFDSYPHHAHRPHTYDGLYGVADQTEPRRNHAAEVLVYDHGPASTVKGNVGSELVDQNINEEAEQFIRMGHKKFNMSRSLSMNSG
ncbi:hypothetical protein ACJRO7_031350 [Eucalyptus globulus]|uniref:Uncharacterized protein n=1 Tax=Eucalyptus globulus TaxID=34317 RepID=A0ABD3JHS7_EUCGL